MVPADDRAIGAKRGPRSDNRILELRAPIDERSWNGDIGEDNGGPAQHMVFQSDGVVNGHIILDLYTVSDNRLVADENILPIARVPPAWRPCQYRFQPQADSTPPVRLEADGADRYMVCRGSAAPYKDAANFEESGPREMKRQTEFVVDGTNVERIQLENSSGNSVTVTNLGARLVSLCAPDRSGDFSDIVAGYDNLRDYLEDPSYMGAVCGRVANRISSGTFDLAGTQIEVTRNAPPHHLHGGEIGFDKRIWSVELIEHPSAVRFSLTAADGEEGYPGTLSVTATYRLSEDNCLDLAIRATSDRLTVVNLTSHIYWNLAGHDAGSALDQFLQIHATHYTPADADVVPTGIIAPVADTAFDFRTPKAIAADIDRAAQPPGIRGYDHNFVLDGTSDSLRPACRLSNPASGRILEISTDQPGLHLYTGEALDGLVGKSGHVYRSSSGIALECQNFPDAPNQPNFPSAQLAPENTYNRAIRYRLMVAD